MSKPPPNCQKCGRDHWNFVRCESAEAFAERQREKGSSGPIVVRAEREDGLRDWGDRLTTLTRLGGGQTFGSSERRTPLQTGSIAHPDWQPPSAA